MNLYEELIQNLIERGILKTPELIEAFEYVKREDFLTNESKQYAYIDTPISIGFGQTNSQPSTVAFLLELLKPEKSTSILDIGSGSGWTTALLAHIASEAYVIGTERIKELVQFGTENLNKYHYKNVKIVEAGKDLGQSGKTFDRILVSAAADRFPQTLLEQLNTSGILVTPVRHSILQIRKDKSGDIHTKEFYGFSFVPLIVEAKY